jgi:hypothetical protein
VQRLLETRLILSQSAKGVERASLALTMTYGRTSPDFLNERKTVVGLAAKF